MIKGEKKLIDFLEKHMVLLAVLFMSALALYLRRQNIWFYTDDYIYYFDMHDNNIQTPLYYLLVRGTEYSTMSPLHAIKWIGGLADFGVAALGVLLCGNIYSLKDSMNQKRGNYEQIKLLLLYAALLFAPVVYLRGCVWAQIDSFAFLLLLAAAYVWDCVGKKGIVVAAIFAGVGAALYAPFVPLVIWYCLCVKKEDKLAKYLWVAVLAVVVVLEVTVCGMVGMTWQQGLLSLIQWTTYHPHTGELYNSVGEWLWQLLMRWLYGIAVVSLLAAYRRRVPYMVVAVLQIVLEVCCGVALGWSQMKVW